MTTPVRYYIVRDEDQPVVRLVAVDVRASQARETSAAVAAGGADRRMEERKRPSVGRVVKAAARRARNAS